MFGIYWVTMQAGRPTVTSDLACRILATFCNREDESADGGMNSNSLSQLGHLNKGSSDCIRESSKGGSNQ